MSDFSKAVGEWQNFYMLLGTASGTLIGLLFVALSLNTKVLDGGRYLRFRYLAHQSFTNFLFLLILSLLFMIPRLTPPLLCVSLLVTGAAGIGYTLFLTCVHLRHRDNALTHRRVIQTPVLTLMTFVLLMLAANDVRSGSAKGLYELPGVMLGMLVLSTRNAWTLLTHLREEAPFASQDSPV